MFTAIANGEKDFEAICIVGGKNGVITDYAMPCGACRQVLSEFCDAEFKVYVGKDENNINEFKLADLLPYSFDKSKLGE
jgi:cytidine deaminase